MSTLPTSVEAPSPPPPWRPPSPLPGFFETERTVMRYWRPEDAAGMLGALNADRASYLPWLPWVGVDNQDEAQCVFQIERMRRDRSRSSPPPDDFTIGIFDRASGRVLGGTGLHRINHAAHAAEIGYWMRPERRGEGLTTEAVAGLITWAFRAQAEGGWGLRRIEILCAGTNAASARVPTKLGLRQEMRLVKHRWVPGTGWEDTLGWGVLAEEWNRG